MKIKKILVVCLSLLFLAAAGCGISDGGKTMSSDGSSFPQTSAVTVVPSSSATSGASSEPISSGGETSSKDNTEESVASAVQSGSEGSSNNSEWVAYDTNKDRYKLHIRKKDGTEDKVIVNDPVLAPCVAGEWVYFLSDLSTIEKVRLDGLQRTKVCGTDAMQHLNGNMSITAEYKNGYILYRTQQSHEVGNNSSYPAHYYKLDPDTNKITEVESN